VSAVGDALKALKTAMLLEERISSQARKVEQLALSVVEIGGRARPAKATEAPSRDQRSLPPPKS
jgi:hypothetical protein